MWTGVGPEQHGVIANGFYHRDRSEVEFWVAKNEVIAGEQIWDGIRSHRSEFTSAVWHAQNIKECGADYIVTPAPIHEPDGTTKLWCYSKPEGLYQKLLDDLGHFPLQHYWGPLSNIESTRWILKAANWLIDKHAPNYHWIYIPHLDYASQKFGPNSPQAKSALQELDVLLGEFAEKISASSIKEQVTYLVAGEYALTDVTGVIYPNRVLREAGLLAVREESGSENIDLKNSQAIAMVDHQIAHIYLNSSKPQVQARCEEIFRNLPGIAGVYAGQERKKIGLNHERAGDLVLVSEDDHWFAYYWWLDDSLAPPFARTVDIHQKPGYDPVELFFDPTTKSIPLNAALIKGSHGVPATTPTHFTTLICSDASGPVKLDQTYRDIDLKKISLELLGL